MSERKANQERATRPVEIPIDLGDRAQVLQVLRHASRLLQRTDDQLEAARHRAAEAEQRFERLKKDSAAEMARLLTRVSELEARVDQYTRAHEQPEFGDNRRPEAQRRSFGMDDRELEIELYAGFSEMSGIGGLPPVHEASRPVRPFLDFCRSRLDGLKAWIKWGP